MNSWFERLSIALVISFIIGGFAVWANDGKQEIRIEDNTEGRKLHTESIQELEKSRIGTDINIAQIRKDLEKLVRILEK